VEELIREVLRLENIQSHLEKNDLSPITILGLSDVSKSYITKVIEEKLKKTMLLITYNELRAQKFHKNIKYLDKEAIYIPKRDIVTYAYDVQNMDIFYSRMNSLIKLYNYEANIIIVSIETLMQPILSKKIMQDNILKLMVANEYNIEELKEKLVKLGYERCDLVEGKGNFSVRGDILDVAISQRKGVRIEFFGDEVDQIRYFDIVSQRSTENINQVKIYPISEEIIKEPNRDIFRIFTRRFYNCIR